MLIGFNIKMQAVSISQEQRKNVRREKNEFLEIRLEGIGNQKACFLL